MKASNASSLPSSWLFMIDLRSVLVYVLEYYETFFDIVCLNIMEFIIIAARMQTMYTTKAVSDSVVFFVLELGKPASSEGMIKRNDLCRVSGIFILFPRYICCQFVYLKFQTTFFD